MFKRTKLCTELLMAFGGVGLLASLNVAAQPAAPAAPDQALQRVEITGSRIRTIEAEGTSPVTVITQESIRASGVRNVETLLNNLPQVFADQGSQVSNGATGSATINLRNLGPERTLVLVNGRRLPAGSPLQVAADVNQIPITLIKRVEVLTGGASSIYGSDAVAGVVNFILDDSFEGFQFDINEQFYNHQQGNSVGDVVRARGFPTPGDKSSDGEVRDVSITLGGNFDGGRGNAVAFLGYKKEKALLESERDFSACALNYRRSTDAFSCGGSGTSFPGRFTDLSSFDFTLDGAGGIRNYTPSTDAYNFGPLNYFQRPSERYIFNTTARYDLNEKIRAYTELSFMDNRTVAQIAPSGVFGTVGVGGANAIPLNFENPLLPAALKTALGLDQAGDSVDSYVFRRNVEGGGRQDDKQLTSYRAVAGLKGDVSDAWSYNTSAQLGRVNYQQTYKNDFSNIRAGRSLDVVTDPATGQPVCRSTLDGSDPNCVPYNIWSPGGVTQDALNYVQIPLFARGRTEQSVFTGTLTGDLTKYGVKSPLATNGLGISVGVERRNESLSLDTDPNFASGDGAGQGGPTIGVAGKYHVNDIFGEMRFPLLEKQPFAELLSANASYRFSDYSTGKKANTYAAGLEYSPVREFKFRGSYQRAVRAANILELYEAQSRGLFDLTADPCGGATPSASAAECARTGVTAAQYGNIAQSPAGQYNQLSGGNPNLDPEKATSYTLGLAFSPVRNLNATIDYFNIKIKDVIAAAPPSQVLNNCLTAGLLCDLIQRDGAGTLWATPAAFIVATQENLAQKKTSGVDLALDYGVKIPSYGGVDFNFVGTRLLKFGSTDIPGSGSYDCVGLYGDTCSAGGAVSGLIPKWRHSLRTTWNTPWDLSVALTWRYIDKVTYEGDDANPLLNSTAGQAGNVEKLASRNYFDLYAAYNLTKNVTARLVINNVFDKDPPIRVNGAGFVNGNTYPVVYDALGRRIGIGLTAKF